MPNIEKRSNIGHDDVVSAKNLSYLKFDLLLPTLMLVHWSEPMIFIGGGNLTFSMLCNATPPVGLLFFTVQIYIANRKILNNQSTYFGVRLRSYFYLAILISTLTVFNYSKHCPGLEFCLI